MQVDTVYFKRVLAFMEYCAWNGNFETLFVKWGKESAIHVHRKYDSSDVKLSNLCRSLGVFVGCHWSRGCCIIRRHAASLSY